MEERFRSAVMNLDQGCRIDLGGSYLAVLGPWLLYMRKSVYIFALHYPGTWLQFENEESKREIESIIRGLEGIVTEAAISLSWFEASLDNFGDLQKEWEQDAELRRQIAEKISKEVGDDYHYDSDKYRALFEKQLRLKKADLGILPRSYIHKIPFIHAHTFVYAVDSFGKFLEEISVYEGVPEQVQHCLEKFNRLLPSVRKIRNSALHIEDRSRGYGSWKEKKQGKKMETNGFLGLSNLEKNQLCYTIDDGSYQRVEISPSVLNILVELSNDLLASFQWQGSPRIAPNY